MPAPVDFVALATAVAEAPAPAATETPAAPVAADPQAPEASAAAELPAEGAPAPEASGDKKPEAKAEPKPDRVVKGFEDLASAKAAFRAEREAALKEYAPLVEAKKSRSALKILEANGVTWKEAAEEILSKGSSGKITEQAEVDPRDARLAALEQEIHSTKTRAARANATGQLEARVKADPAKFKHVAHFKAEGEALRYIEQYFNENDELPAPGDVAESMEIALEAVEAHYVKEADRWRGVLTPGSGSANVPVSKSAVPADGAVSQQAPKTLTNNVGAGPAPTSAATKKPKTDEDYQRAVIEALSAQ